MDYINRIDKITHQFKSTFGELTYEQLNESIDNKQWSVSQNIEHLIKVNQSFFPIFKTIQKGKLATPLIGSFKFYANYIGNSILKSVQPDNQKKIKTTPSWRPKKAAGDELVLENFITNQEDLKEHIINMEKWIKRNIVIYSPASKALVYPLQTAIEIIITHEQRHFEQAKKIMNLI